jgi:hypothetical protein
VYGTAENFMGDIRTARFESEFLDIIPNAKNILLNNVIILKC